jgi:23S rRNA pseudouridine2605 synthase
VLAHAGLGSRRSCEELISQGRVWVDGEIVRELGRRVDAARSRIAVDGEPIKLETMVYYAVNKPKGYVSTTSDPGGRPRVVDLLPEIPQRVYSVGRLDEDSTGLMILTNDGDLANRLAHPRYGVEKTYRALVAGLAERETISKLTEGIWLSDGKVRAKRARIVGRQGQATLIELVLAEGKKREVRRMLSKLGHKVMALNRLAVGPVNLHGLSVGHCRPLSRYEVDLLRKAASGALVSPVAFSESKRSSITPPRRRARHRSRKVEEKRPSRALQARKTQTSPSRERQGRIAPLADSRPTTGLTQPPPARVGARRRIIGLETRQLASPGLSLAGRRKPRRPPRLKRQPPGAGSRHQASKPGDEGRSKP